MSKNESLMRMIRMLVIGADDTKRQKEKSLLEKKYHESDKRLNLLVKDNLNDLTTIMSTFSNILHRVGDSQERIHILKDNLISCKNLLNCKRVEIRKLWIDGIRSRTIVAMLDKMLLSRFSGYRTNTEPIEKVKDVNIQLDLFVKNKMYLHASELLCSTTKLLDDELKDVGALNNLKDEMATKKDELGEILMAEIQLQIYSKCTSIIIHNFKRQGSQRNSSKRRDLAAIRTLNDTDKQNEENLSRLNNVSLIKLTKVRVIVEDLDIMNPDDDVIKFVTVIISALDTLGKLPEAITMIKERIEEGLQTMIQSTSVQLTENSNMDEDELANQLQPQNLLELLRVVFDQIKVVTKIHLVLLANLERINASRDKQEQLEMYSLQSVWDTIQIVIQEELKGYLNIRSEIDLLNEENASNTIMDDVTQFFRKKPKTAADKVALFRFEESAQCYTRDQNIITESGRNSNKVLVCKSTESNITTNIPYNLTAIYSLVKEFIAVIEQAKPGGRCQLYTFIDEFVRKNYITRMQSDISKAVKKQTQNEERQYRIVDQRTQQELNIERPVLQATVCVVRSVQELINMMCNMSEYGDSFLFISISILSDYLDTCKKMYADVVLDNDYTKTISGIWAIDDDINRFLRMMPNWRNLKEQRNYERQTELSEDDLRAMSSKESAVLTENLVSKDQQILESEIIVEIPRMQRIAYLCESMDWLADHLTLLQQNIKSKITIFNITPNILSKFEKLVDEFKNQSELALTVLYLETRVHCFYFLVPITKQKGNYVNVIDDMDPDNYVINLNKDLHLISEELRLSLSTHRFKYVFEGLGHLCSTIFISCTQYLKRINENGIKKMCRNILAVQQKLTEITQGREAGLDHARQYFELLYQSTEEILKVLVARGPQYSEQEYLNLLKLAYSSERGISSTVVECKEEVVNDLNNRLTDILREYKSLV